MLSLSEKFSSFKRVLWLYTKYQVITKGLLSLIVFPLSGLLMQYLLYSSGRTSISSGDYLSFLFSFQGLGMLLLGLGLLILLIGTDINTFIIMSALIQEGKIGLSVRDLLVVGLSSLKAFLKPSGLLIMLFVALIVPLVGIGFTIGPMSNFQIPNFITDVIFKNTLYKSAYVGLLVLLGALSALHTFVFHYMLLLNQEAGLALKNARGLMLRHWKAFIKDFLGVFFTLILVGFFIFLGLIVGMAFASEALRENLFASRFVLLLGILVLSEFLGFVALVSVPVMIERLTKLFYRYNEKDGTIVKTDFKVDEKLLPQKVGFGLRLKKSLKALILLILFCLGNIGFGAFLAFGFDEIFNPKREIEIIAHRGGGDLAAENSLLSLEEAIKAGAKWSEIDVQRTKDNRYIINHDANFQRVAGESRAPSEMTFEEIKKLKIADLFDSSRPSQEVPSLEEFLERSKGRIGLFIELKGATADEKMADDVIKMVKERGMLDEVALISLDYSLISYIEKTAPEVNTGFLYFFSVGATAEMNGDMLIMEEREATPEKINEIQGVGKKAIVWTVNTEASIDKFVNSEIDGVITDYVLAVQEGLERRNKRSDIEIIMDNFLN